MKFLSNYFTKIKDHVSLLYFRLVNKKCFCNVDDVDIVDITKDMCDGLGVSTIAKPTRVQVRTKNFDKAKKGECFRNSMLYVLENPEAKLVLGYVFTMMVPFEHAWVKVNGTHNEITFIHSDMDQYVAVAEFTHDRVKKFFDEKGTVPTLERMHDF